MPTIRSAPPALLIVVVGAVRLLQLVSLQLILLLVLSQLVLLRAHLPNKHASLFMARHIRGGHRIPKPGGYIKFTMGHDRWSTFLSRTLLRARGASFFISRFVQSGMQLSPRIVKYFSQSLVNSICEYGVQIWGPFLCSQADLRKHLTAIDTLKFSVLRSSLGLHRYYPSLPRKSYWHPTSSFLLRTDMGVAPMRHRCAELLFPYWNTSLEFNKDYFTITFRQRWADFNALAPATSYSDSWFPLARALFASFVLTEIY